MQRVVQAHGDRVGQQCFGQALTPEALLLVQTALGTGVAYLLDQQKGEILLLATREHQLQHGR